MQTLFLIFPNFPPFIHPVVFMLLYEVTLPRSISQHIEPRRNVGNLDGTNLQLTSLKKAQVNEEVNHGTPTSTEGMWKVDGTNPQLTI